MNMDVVATYTDRVWRCKLNDEIDTYKTKINTQIKAAFQDSRQKESGNAPQNLSETK